MFQSNIIYKQKKNIQVALFASVFYVIKNMKRDKKDGVINPQNYKYNQF